MMRDWHRPPKRVYGTFPYAKILGEINFQPREFPQSGSKAKDGKEKRKREKKTERW